MKTVQVNNEARIKEEKALALQMQNGTETQKQNAFNLLHKAHVGALTFKVMTHFKMDKEIARDLVQEIFMKVFLNIDKYESTNAFSTWLYKIANNHIIDRKRQSNYEVLNYEVLQVNGMESSEDSGTSAMVFQLEDKSANNHELLVRKERAEMVHEAIATAIKSEETRMLLYKVFIEDKPYEDISKEMKLPVGTIKALIHRAKETLKNHLSKKSIDFEYGRICTTKFKTLKSVQAQ